MKYQITFNGKTYHHNGDNAQEAFEKFRNRKVFGEPLVYQWTLTGYDADTSGERWATYAVQNGEKVSVEALES
jgi:hypothetical protein